jgi:GrpB-like predicted nucleotidyltransferase (UPF0157 family)
VTTDEAAVIAAWARLREAKGPRATVIDLYRLAAEPRGLQPQELPRAERIRLARLAGPLVWPGFEVTPGSERDDPIVLAEYDADWPARFTEWRSRIADSLGGVALRIEHVGSTSVPGLLAKPRIDIQISVRDLLDEAAYVPALEAVGIQLRIRDALHRYFRPFAGRPRDVQVHVCNIGSRWERDHLLFRDFLRAQPRDAEVYAQAKREAVRDWADDGWAYTDAKSEVILGILDKAERWAEERGWRS